MAYRPVKKFPTAQTCYLMERKKERKKEKNLAIVSIPTFKHCK